MTSVLLKLLITAGISLPGPGKSESIYKKFEITGTRKALLISSAGYKVSVFRINI